MQRRIKIGDRAFVLELMEAEASGGVRFRLDDGQREASVIEVMPRVWSVLMDGRSFEARVIGDEADICVEIDGERYPVTVEDPRRSRHKGSRVAGEGRISVTAPMPGKIVRLLAAAGDTVETGHGLVVIEAMKMQNEMKAPRSGRVASVPVKEGDTVSAGAVLAVIE